MNILLRNQSFDQENCFGRSVHKTTTRRGVTLFVENIVFPCRRIIARSNRSSRGLYRTRRRPHRMSCGHDGQHVTDVNIVVGAQPSPSVSLFQYVRSVRPLNAIRHSLFFCATSARFPVETILKKIMGERVLSLRLPNRN